MTNSQTQNVIRWAGISLGVGIAATIPLLALAQAQEYVPLAAIPGLTNQGSLSGFLNAAFRLGIVVAGFLAVVLIAYNGLVYMTSGAVGSKSDALGWIQDIFWGLALILFSVIILRTINPDILNFRLGVEKLAPEQKLQTPAGPITAEQGRAIDQEAAKCSGTYTAVRDQKTGAISGVCNTYEGSGTPLAP